ncbi:uncharacterized protein LOC109723705 [Ananas comosus]|uniref:Uncharacterized protein LOC109723705 n=1 Tax=Ananas comosus TaxID=4615 RepID=A0A6P5GGI0_ANACO|nr:uncharacterized protein LOC109723705 [Ananas comosus]
MASLVDYDDDDDDESSSEAEAEAVETIADAEAEEEAKSTAAPSEGSVARPSPPPQNQSAIPPSLQNSNVVSPLPPPSFDELPDVSLLLASPSAPTHQTIGSYHSSRVASAMSDSASKKRESNGSAFQHPPSKQPRGQLRHLRNVPDTMGNALIPPQLRGRSNVVTEDVSKLFVSRRRESSG